MDFCLAPSWVSTFLPRGAWSFVCSNREQHGADGSDCSPHPITDTVGTSNLKEAIQIIAAHVKAIRRLGKRFSVCYPEASKKLWRKALGRNGSLFGDKEGGWRASVATWKRHSSQYPPPCIPRGGPEDQSVTAWGHGVTAAGCTGFSIDWAYVF